MNQATSYGVGALMGLILIASAMMLSRIERTAEIFNFFFTQQSAQQFLQQYYKHLAYHTITHDWITSAIKGAGFPMLKLRWRIRFLCIQLIIEEKKLKMPILNLKNVWQKDNVKQQ
jgi:hypothetical protein